VLQWKSGWWKSVCLRNIFTDRIIIMRTFIFMNNKQTQLKTKKWQTVKNLGKLNHCYQHYTSRNPNLFCSAARTSSMHWWFAQRNWFGGHTVVSLLRQPTSVLSSKPSLQSSSPSHAHVTGIQRPVLLQWKSVFGHTRVSETRTDKSFLDSLLFKI